MIELDALTFRYAGAEEPALRSLSLRVPRGGFLGILGPSRSGKTTLLSVLSGAVPHHRPGDFYGACRVGGLDTVEHTPTDLSRIVGSVFQDIDAQMVSSLVEDELLFALENFGVPRGELDGRIREALSAVGIEDLRHRSLDTLSGGQKQKVAIAAVLAMRPQVLALDEPTGELDPASSAAVFSLLSALNARGVTIVVAEQKLSLLAAHCKTLCVLDSGSIALQGDVREVLSQPRRLEALGLRVPRIAALGVGCRRGTPQAALEAAFSALLARGDLRPQAVRKACSLDRKQDEPGLLAFCRAHGFPLETFGAPALRAVPGDFAASPFVERVTGVDNVCERAALLDAEKLIVQKTARDGVTVALALAPYSPDWRWKDE